jgi:CrcB protein
MTRRLTLPAELAVISAGGALGATLRYLIDRQWPTPTPDFPWPTLVINVVGASLLAALLSAGVRVWRHPLDVLFAGSGILGGFTTFSAYAVQTNRMLAAGHAVQAVAYAGGTVLAAVVASHLVRTRVLQATGQ